MKHTPGPWTAEVFSDGAFSIKAPMKNVRGVLYECTIAARNYWSRNAEQSEANAHLIAAAPELLEACETLIKRWESEFIPPAEKLSYCVGMLRTAIAKAKGETP